MIERLRALAAFRSFPEAGLATLAGLASARRLEAGDVLFRQGDPGDAVYVVETGEIEIVKGGRTLARLRAGQTVGEMALFEEETRSADARAAVPTTLFGFPAGAFENLLRAQPACGAHFLFDAAREMSRRLRRTSEYLLTVFEVGRIVAAGHDLKEMGERILGRLLADVEEATGGRLLLQHPLADECEETCAVGEHALSGADALDLVGRRADERRFEEAAGGVVRGAALENERHEVVGWLLLEKRGVAEPFTVEQGIVLEAVAHQTGLGVLAAWAREEEAARSRLERARQQGY